MSEKQQMADHIIDLLTPFAACQAKGMFGGYGIFRDGLMFGLITEGDFYLKADDENRDKFEEAGCQRFCYYKQDKPYYLSYHIAPESIFDDEESMIEWINQSWQAALRAPPKKRKAKKRQ
jgi:DNA transformation protein and related proteins